MSGQTNLELAINSLLGFYTRRGKNGSITTTANYVPLVVLPTPAQLVYISNTSGKTLNVSSDNGATFLALPDGAIFPFNNIGDLSSISVRASDSTTGLVVTFRYEI